MTQFAISIPQTFPTGRVDPQLIKDFLARAEALGCFDAAWDQEQILGRMPTLEPVDLLTFSAACTTRLRLGSAVLLTALRSPVHLAKSLSTLDQLSQGRLIVGVGLGAAKAIYPAFGAQAETRAARFAEGIRLMKALWTQDSVDFEGRFWQLKNAAMEPKPVQKPHPPVWFGGGHPNALKRAAALGDGFIGAGSTSTSDFVRQVQDIRRFLAEAGRDPAAFPIGKRVYIAVDDDADRAWRGLEQWFGLRYGRTEYQHIAIWGPADECAAKVKEVIDAGAVHLLFTPVYDEAEQMERIAAGVIPKLS
ncbi:MAG TPA: LLM class flavin-dependent oxidoreductase [Chloroflexota bacterium]|nr:LLM class flavin-dependent oxidoreductase [Chloroflexota bacterium]